MARSYARFFAILKDVNATGATITKEEVISSFTNGRTVSLSDVSDFELKELETTMQKMIGNKQAIPKYNPVHNDTRRAIISQFKSIGKTTADAIAWAEKYGVNGNKRKFNDYDGQELFILLKNAKKVKTDAIKAVNKKLQ